MASDAEDSTSPSRFTQLDVPEVGVVLARKPMPNAIPALAMAANAKLGNQERANYLVLFVRNHLAPGELERVYHDMITGPLPSDSIERISREIATWGTARPTSPSSLSA